MPWKLERTSVPRSREMPWKPGRTSEELSSEGMNMESSSVSTENEREKLSYTLSQMVSLEHRWNREKRGDH
jgi:hypothetical protein